MNYELKKYQDDHINGFSRRFISNKWINPQNLEHRIIFIDENLASEVIPKEQTELVHIYRSIKISLESCKQNWKWVHWIELWVQLKVSALNWIVSAINGKFKEWEPKRMFSFLDCHESKLSLIAWETVIFLFNHQFISISIRPKSISLEQSC